jgi:hypothetical protein
MIELPPYARVIRALPRGEHPYLALLPLVRESPAARSIASCAISLDQLLDRARVRIEPGDGYIWVDDEAPAIVLVEKYYLEGSCLDLYLDLLHELTHLRQLVEGLELWDDGFRYVNRPTEIEGYAVAVEEGRRLGMTESEILQHLSNPWMSRPEVALLYENITRFLATGRMKPYFSDRTGSTSKNG